MRRHSAPAALSLWPFSCATIRSLDFWEMAAQVFTLNANRVLQRYRSHERRGDGRMAGGRERLSTDMLPENSALRS
jgi:hypothetical protein